MFIVCLKKCLLLIKNFFTTHRNIVHHVFPKKSHRVFNNIHHLLEKLFGMYLQNVHRLLQTVHHLLEGSSSFVNFENMKSIFLK